MDDAETVTKAEVPSAGTQKPLQEHTYSAKSDDQPQHQLVERWLSLNDLCLTPPSVAGKNKSISEGQLTLTNKVTLMSSMYKRVFWFDFQIFIRVFRNGM